MVKPKFLTTVLTLCVAAVVAATVVLLNDTHDKHEGTALPQWWPPPQEVLFLPVPYSSPVPSKFSPKVEYVIALMYSERIAQTITAETSARNEALRIQGELDSEITARNEAKRIQAQRDSEIVAERAAVIVVKQAQTSAPPPPIQTASNVYLGDTLYAVLALTPWPKSMWPTVNRVVKCESGGLTTADNGRHKGLMQVDPYFHGAVPSDAAGQLTQAYAVYQKQGWSAWQCY